jgi:AraC-like DNA-binding protein
MLAFGQHTTPRSPTPLAPGPAGVATFTLGRSELAAAAHRPRCLDHHLLVLVNAGHGELLVDFVARPCRPGTLLWIRPGQTVQVPAGSGLDAVLVVWDSAVHPTPEIAGLPADDPFGPGYWQLAGEDEDAIISEVSQLAVDCRRHDSGPLAAALLQHELAVLLLRVGLLSAPALPRLSRAEARTFERFRRALEDGHAVTRRVEEYAARLDCSVRTLTRAGLAATGRSAKQLIDDRVALAAKRMLACTDLPVAEIGRRLGFVEPTNFGRFFHRSTGSSPGAFRAAATAAKPARATAGGRVPTQRRSSDTPARPNSHNSEGARG